MMVSMISLPFTAVIQFENHVYSKKIFFLFIQYRCLLDDTVRLAGEVLLISAKTGKLLNVSIVPDLMESYYSPQLLQKSSDEEYILIGTGGETHGGGLYAFNLRCFTSLCSDPVESNNHKVEEYFFIFLVYRNNP